MKDETYLLIVAHPDDEVLGFGGTGTLLSNAGKIVQPLILCSDVENRSQRPNDSELLLDIANANKLLGFQDAVFANFPNLRFNSIDEIDVVRFIEDQILKFKPSHIYTHHPSDMNSDHQIISRSTLVASKVFQRNNEKDPIETISYIEIPSSTEWNLDITNNLFRPNIFVNIDETIENKIQALSCYRNVMRKPPHPRSEEFIRGLAIYRGGQSGNRYAESFQCIYQTLKI
tara:strand:+ start:153 stop:842 length:690 start_codon:yes stop_codon:yes gene_type:complete